MDRNLTDRQLELLNFIRAYCAENGESPTLLEMAKALRVSDVKGVSQHCERLERKGYIVKTAHRHRSITLVSPEDQPNSVPVYGKVAAGLPIDITANIDRMVTIPDDLFRIRPDFLMQVTGDSMVDIGIHDGDLAGIKRSRTAQHGQIVLATVDTDEMSREERKECGLNTSGITLKRLSISGSRLILKSENKEKNYAPLVVKPERVRIEGRFVGLVRGG